MSPNVPIPVEALLRGPFPPGKSWRPLRVDMTELVMGRILRGAAIRLVPAQSGKEWFSEAAIFVDLRVPSSAALFVDRSGGRLISVPKEEGVDEGARRG